MERLSRPRRVSNFSRSLNANIHRTNIIKSLIGLLKMDCSLASASFAVLAACASVVAIGAVKLLDSKSNCLDGSIHNALSHIQVYRLVWDASSMQFASRLQHNERYYISDPVGSITHNSFVAATISVFTDCQ